LQRVAQLWRLLPEEPFLGLNSFADRLDKQSEPAPSFPPSTTITTSYALTLDPDESLVKPEQ
ncbi:MAG: hypothetical protein KKD53_03795, partial [Proteobacteria bacterium]|nr:hypothetical protein [Pseudomonadota bacterium]